jgi:hypothetical protein
MIGQLFQVINFGIFAALMVYVMRKYLVSFLQEALVKEYREMESLKNEHARLADEQKNLEGSIAAQEDEAMSLFKKVNHWRNVVELRKKAEKANQEKLLAEAQQKAKKQLTNYIVHNTYEKVVPLVVQRLTSDLSEQFEDEAKGHAYITTLLEKL